MWITSYWVEPEDSPLPELSSLQKVAALIPLHPRGRHLLPCFSYSVILVCLQCGRTRGGYSGGQKADSSVACGGDCRRTNLSRHGIKGGDWSEWSGRRDSNPRHQPWQGCTLPAELLPLSNQLSLSRDSVSAVKRAGRRHRVAGLDTIRIVIVILLKRRYIKFL